jgi:DNA-binding response OmpR family regulator
MDNSKKRILVVEDEQYLRDLYVEILAREGYQVDQAADGEEGFNAMHKGGYDLVLLDIMLPKMDGFQILEKLQTDSPVKPNKVIIVLTNLSKDSNIARGVALGARGYMIKADYTPDQLIKEVQNYLSAE